MENNEVKKELPKYGTPGYTFDLAWHDESKRDYLVVVDAKKTSEIMNQRSKGTTIYDMINIYGGIDNVTAAFSDREREALFDDVSDMPEFGNDSEYTALVKRLQSQVDELSKKVNQSESKPEVQPEVNEGDK